MVFFLPCLSVSNSGSSETSFFLTAINTHQVQISTHKKEVKVKLVWDVNNVGLLLPGRS